MMQLHFIIAEWRTIKNEVTKIKNISDRRNKICQKNVSNYYKEEISAKGMTIIR